MAGAIKAVTMEARQVGELPHGVGWQYEPKWDGFRCLARKTAGSTGRDGKPRDGTVELTARSGKSLTRYFPDVAERLAQLDTPEFVLDGELIIPLDGQLSFEALQLRLHPSPKRVRKLASETPALLMVFDILRTADGVDAARLPLRERRRLLERFFATLDPKGVLRLSPVTDSRAQAQRWLARAGGGALDGVVAKELDAVYRAGERAMLKIKCLRTADCVVGGFRYATGNPVVGSLLLGLYDESGRLDHVGFTSGFAQTDREALTRTLEKRRGGPGFTGDVPGGPSRWSTDRSAEWQPLEPKLVAEVQYDHVSGGRFRHGTRFLRWRPDKAPRQCTRDQLQLEAAPSRLLRKLVG